MQHGFPCRYGVVSRERPTVRYAIPNNVRSLSSDPSLVKRAHRSPMLLPDRPRPPQWFTSTHCPSPRPKGASGPVLGAHPFQLVARAIDHGGKIEIGGRNLSAADQTSGDGPERG